MVGRRMKAGLLAVMMRRPTHVLLDEGVVCEGNSPPAYPGLSSLQDELANRLQVGKSEYSEHQ